MKVTINGKVNKEVLKSILDEQKEKTKVIDEFVKANKLTNVYYKDAELEYETSYSKPAVKSKKVEVETRWVRIKKLD